MNPHPTPGRHRLAAPRGAAIVGALIAALVVALALALAPSATAQATTTQTTLRVEGMTCTGCEATVGSVLTGLDGVSDARPDRSTRTVAVTYDPARVTPEQMIQAINTNTYYQASAADGSTPAPRPTPVQNGATIAVWVVGALAVLVAGVLLLRHLRGRRPAAPGSEH